MKKVNLVAVTGFFMCLAAIIYGIAANGGLNTIVNFLHFPSLLVTLGGSLFAVLTTSDSFSDFMDGLGSFLSAFQKPQLTAEMMSEQILELSDLSRREGLLALEERTAGLAGDFLSKGIRLVVDGSDPELVKDILENELVHTDERNRRRIRFWEDFGACAPAWGMVGTLLGLINMMRVMGTDAGAIGEGMSLALITTLYGSLIANWICIPIARKLEKNSAQETLVMEVVIEGVLSIQAGENSRIIKEKIKSILEPEEKEEEEAA